MCYVYCDITVYISSLIREFHKNKIGNMTYKIKYHFISHVKYFNIVCPSNNRPNYLIYTLCQLEAFVKRVYGIES